MFDPDCEKWQEKSLYARSAVLLYAILTQLIVWLGNIREDLFDGWHSSRWDMDWSIRKDRTFPATTDESQACCDCGLTHVAIPRRGSGKSVEYRLRPIRPVGYQYRLRLGMRETAEFRDETGDKWNAHQQTTE